jgi:hypothetical protein
MFVFLGGTDNSRVASDVSIFLGGPACFLIELVPSLGRLDVE